MKRTRYDAKDAMIDVTDNTMIDLTDGNYDPDEADVNKLPKDEYWKYWFGNLQAVLCIVCNIMPLYRTDHFHLGHQIPKSKGGTYHPDNIIPICGHCNSAMRDNYTIAGYVADKTKFKSTSDTDWLNIICCKEPKTVFSLREYYKRCGAFSLPGYDPNKFEVTYKGRKLALFDPLPEDTYSDDFLVDIFK